jgi:PTH1 family peptidyl-tRNA hydrolase
MQLWVGLGNPGRNMRCTGTMSASWRPTPSPRCMISAVKKQFQGWTQEGRIGSEKILLLKPATFMNESGRSVGEAMRFYKLDVERRDRLPRRARSRAVQGEGEARRRHGRP